MKDLNMREQNLMAFGEAITSNCIPCTKYHNPEARKAARALNAVFAFFAITVPFLALAQQTQQPNSPPFWGWGSPWHPWHGEWGFWWIVPLFMFILMIVCVINFRVGRRSANNRLSWGPCRMMDRASGTGHSRDDATYSAIEILNVRFAKGEIHKQEYDETRAAILSRDPN